MPLKNQKEKIRASPWKICFDFFLLIGGGVSCRAARPPCLRSAVREREARAARLRLVKRGETNTMNCAVCGAPAQVHVTNCYKGATEQELDAQQALCLACARKLI